MNGCACEGQHHRQGEAYLARLVAEDKFLIDVIAHARAQGDEELLRVSTDYGSSVVRTVAQPTTLVYSFSLMGASLTCTRSHPGRS